MAALEKRGGSLRMIQQKEGMKERVIKDNTYDKFEDTNGITNIQKVQPKPVI